MYSKELSEIILRMRPKVAAATQESLQEALTSMGPGCFFDDPANEDEALGAIKVLHWIEQQLDYDQNPNQETIR